MNRFNPKPRIFVKIFNWKAPDTLEARADVQDLFRLQGRKPDHFRNGIGHPAKTFLTLLQRRLSTLALDGHACQMSALVGDLMMLRGRTARFAREDGRGS